MRESLKTVIVVQEIDELGMCSAGKLKEIVAVSVVVSTQYQQTFGRGQEFSG